MVKYTMRLGSAFLRNINASLDFGEELDMNGLSKKCDQNDLVSLLGLHAVSPLEAFMERPEAWTFKNIPKREQTADLVDFAVENDGLLLKYVSKKLITPELCEKAVMQNGRALRAVPEKYLSAALCAQAVASSGYAIKDVPAEFLTYDLMKMAVSHSVKIENEWDHAPIADIPYISLTAELNMLSVQYCPRSLKNIYKKFMSKKLLTEALSRDGTAIEFVPENKMTDELIQLAVKSDPRAWELVPESKKTKQRKKQIQEICPGARNAITSRSDARLKEKTFLPERPKPVIFSLKAKRVQTPKSVAPEFTRVEKRGEQALCHYGMMDDRTMVPVYYISDIHLEFQLRPIYHAGITTGEIEHFLDQNIRTMIKGADTQNGYLLIAGDVADSTALHRMFFMKLKEYWRGTILAVLGNHELWDDHPESAEEQYQERTVDEIVEDYCDPEPYLREFVDSPGILQNSLFVRYKNQEDRIVSENQILDATAEELRELCERSTFLVLGGIGFSGRNPHYNADLGLYRETVQTLEEDRKQSDRFLRVYQKIEACAGERRVIVLTHTQAENWLNEPYNPHWIYINGHTHINALLRKPDGTTVLSDNQIGYQPCKWKLSGFTVSGWYDPLEKYENGIHLITADLYADFNAGRGIVSTRCSYEGDIYALKRDGIYLFLLKRGKTLCLLEGSRRHRLECTDMAYYYDHMSQYHQNIKSAMMPYRQAVQQLAEEVRQFGGTGTVHGCIVDISFFSHLYLNPFDGTVSPYWTLDTLSREVYDTVLALIQAQEPQLKKRYLKAAEKQEIPLLSRCADGGTSHGKEALASVPRVLLGTELYEPSRAMRAVQYVFDQDVIRVWNEEILCANFGVIDGHPEKLLPESVGRL